jgi:hypothetical protein
VIYVVTLTGTSWRPNVGYETVCMGGGRRAIVQNKLTMIAFHLCSGGILHIGGGVGDIV